jgi:zinc and cadmium transporter
VDVKFGVITTFAIILHEIPQELGDFAISVYGGMSKYKALMYNLIAASTAVVGAAIGYYFSTQVESFSIVIMPFAAGGFIYIAACDLIPEIHKEKDLNKASGSMRFFILGISLILIFKLLVKH